MKYMKINAQQSNAKNQTIELKFVVVCVFYSWVQVYGYVRTPDLTSYGQCFMAMQQIQRVLKWIQCRILNFKFVKLHRTLGREIKDCSLIFPVEDNLVNNFWLKCGQKFRAVSKSIPQNSIFITTDDSVAIERIQFHRQHKFWWHYAVASDNTK